jgi:hypothetical protein
MSATEICNIALTRLGHGQIEDISTSTGKAADLCRLHYERTRDSVLRAHPWNFAVRRVALAQDATAPSHEYTYRYALPRDCLKVIRTSYEASGYTSTDDPLLSYWGPASIPYRIEGRFLLINEANVSIEYIARIIDTMQMDDLFVDLLAQRLAAEMSMGLTDNQAATKTMWEIYNQKLAEARTVDSMEGSSRDVVDTSTWLIART